MSLNVSIDKIKSLYPEVNLPFMSDNSTSPVKESDENCTRASVIYKNHSERFQLSSTLYTQQYSAIYACRLHQLKNRVKKQAALIWPECPFLDGIQMLTRNVDFSIIYGVLYKDMKLKPSVLKQYLKDLELETPTNGFLSDDDRLYLEDETIRIELIRAKNFVRDLLPNELVTGLVIACKGSLTLSGNFEVVDWTLPGVMFPVKELECPATGSQYIAFLSDLRLGSAVSDYGALLKLRSFIVGSLRTSQPTTELSQSIVRVVIIGTTFSSEADPLPGLTKNLTLASKINVTTPLQTLEEADIFLYDLACSVPVDLMPGAHDPTNYSLPQNALHQAFFPQSRRLASFQSVTNPYQFSLSYTNFLSVPHQSVVDIKNFTSLESDLDVLKLCVEAQHLCPTAPDTLACYPFTESDPFCFPSNATHVPHVIFSSSLGSFDFSYYNSESRTWEKTRSSKNDPLIVCIPCFTQASTMILVELNTLEVQVCKF